jgi:hypothetical protein
MIIDYRGSTHWLRLDEVFFIPILARNSKFSMLEHHQWNSKLQQSGIRKRVEKKIIFSASNTYVHSIT